MRKHTPKLNVNITGKMNENDAGYVGKRLAIAGLIFASCSGVALLLYVIGCW